MLLELEPKLEDRIVEVFATQTRITAQELLENLASKGECYSLQGIYKALKKLVEQGILLKEKKYFLLDVNWLMNLAYYSEKVRKLHQEQSALGQMNLKERQRWEFNDLFQARHFFLNLTLSVIHKNARHQLLYWSPHPWSFLVEDLRERRFWKTLEGLDIEAQKLLALRDSVSLPDWCRTNVLFSDREQGLFGAEHASVNVYGDMFTTLSMEPETSETLSEFIQRGRPIDRRELSRAVMGREFYVSLAHDEQLASVCREEFRWRLDYRLVG